MNLARERMSRLRGLSGLLFAFVRNGVVIAAHSASGRDADLDSFFTYGCQKILYRAGLRNNCNDHLRISENLSLIISPP